MYPNMAELLLPAVEGTFKIEHFAVGPNDFRAIIDGNSPGEYVKLTHNGTIMMSNTRMEWRTNREFVGRAHGDVLIGGLGIGMIVMAIQDNERVKSITVLEKHQEVIDMVSSQLPFNEKVSIVCADVFEWRPPKGCKYDCIYMDIWNYINRDVYNEGMKPLKRKWGHYLKPITESPKRFNKCWAEWYAKNGIRI